MSRSVPIQLICFVSLLLTTPVPTIAGDSPSGTNEAATPSSEKGKRISRLIDRLDEKYLSARLNARKKLIDLGSEAVPQLMKAARSAPFRVRENSIIALGKIGDERALPLLINGYLSDNVDLQAAARKAIQLFGLDALDALRKYIREHPQKGRRVEKLENRLIRVRIEKTLIGEISPNRGSGFYEGQFREIKPLGQKAVPTLKKMARGKYDFLRSPPPHVKEIRRRTPLTSDPISRMAVDAIGVVGTDEQIPFLKEILGDKPSTEGLKEAAAVALYRLGEEKPLTRIKNNLRDRYQSARKRDRNRIAVHYGDKYAMILARMGKNKKAISVYRSLLKQKTSRRIGNGPRQLWWYNLACSYAQIGKKKKALRALEKSVQNGYRDLGWIKIDGDLDPIRDMKKFKDIKSTLGEGPIIETKTHPDEKDN